jgi:hypothetical protein
MSEEPRITPRRVALTLAWVSTLYGCLLIVDGAPANDTAGWVFFAVPILLVIGERITRGDEEAEPDAANDADDASAEREP